MNYYIDFDYTLYNTGNFVNDMIETLALYITKAKKSINKIEAVKQIDQKFNKEKIYNIFSVCEYLGDLYKVNDDELKSLARKVLRRGEKYIYEDVLEFLEYLKPNNILNILTAASNADTMEYQSLKVSGSKITKYFDNIIITTQPKNELNLDYSNGIFIDDNPDIINVLSTTNAKKIIHIKRPGGKYSNEKIDNLDIEECESLLEIMNNKMY